jgi:hypothetical protein
MLRLRAFAAPPRRPRQLRHLALKNDVLQTCICPCYPFVRFGETQRLVRSDEMLLKKTLCLSGNYRALRTQQVAPINCATCAVLHLDCRLRVTVLGEFCEHLNAMFRYRLTRSSTRQRPPV